MQHKTSSKLTTVNIKLNMLACNVHAFHTQRLFIY